METATINNECPVLCRQKKFVYASFQVSLPLRRDVTKDLLKKMPRISKFPEVFHLNYENAVLNSTVYDVIVPFPFYFVFLPTYEFVCIIIADENT